MTSIAELRARNGKMSQRELAKELGTTQATVSHWEKKPLSMNAKVIVKMCLLFGVSSDELLGISEVEKSSA